VLQQCLKHGAQRRSAHAHSKNPEKALTHAGAPARTTRRRHQACVLPLHLHLPGQNQLPHRREHDPQRPAARVQRRARAHAREFGAHALCAEAYRARSYSYAKRMLEVQSRLSRAAHGLDAVCVIPVRPN
jgi:hypothetical protein